MPIHSSRKAGEPDRLVGVIRTWRRIRVFVPGHRAASAFVKCLNLALVMGVLVGPLLCTCSAHEEHAPKRFTVTAKQPEIEKERCCGCKKHASKPSETVHEKTLQEQDTPAPAHPRCPSHGDHKQPAIQGIASNASSLILLQVHIEPIQFLLPRFANQLTSKGFATSPRLGDIRGTNVVKNVLRC